MSIYPVRLNEWYPVTDPNYMGEIIQFYRCEACFSIPNYKKAVGHHSLPFGYGEVWCNWKCLRSGKKGKLDKRQQRKLNRRLKFSRYLYSKLTLDNKLDYFRK